MDNGISFNMVIKDLVKIVERLMVGYYSQVPQILQ